MAGYAELGNIPEYFKYKEGVIEGGFDWDKIKNASQQFCFVASDNDQYLCGADQAEIMQRHLGGEIIIKKGQGHFNSESNPPYKEFPFLLKLID